MQLEQIMRKRFFPPYACTEQRQEDAGEQEPPCRGQRHAKALRPVCCLQRLHFAVHHARLIALADAASRCPSPEAAPGWLTRWADARMIPPSAAIDACP